MILNKMLLEGKESAEDEDLLCDKGANGCSCLHAVLAGAPDIHAAISVLQL